MANPELVEAVVVNPREVLVNGKSPGETSLVVEQENGNRLLYDLTIRPRAAKLEAVRLPMSGARGQEEGAARVSAFGN